MRRASLIRQSLVHYWRINLAVIAGVATAVAVLAGALIVGDSVRASLRDLALERLGQADHAVLSSGFFRDQLAEDLQSHARFASAFDSAAPLIILEGFVTDQTSGRRASHVQVYGIDERFWRFHGLGGISAPDSTEAMVSEGLAGDIGLAAGGSILLRVQNPSAIPIESLHGRKEDVGRTVRLSVRQVLTAGQLGEFSLSQQQGSISAVFVPLQRMQLLLDQPSKVNALLIADRPAPSGAGVASPTEPQHEVLETLVRETTRLEDLGLHLRALDQQVSLVLESDSTVISQSEAAAAQAAAHRLGLATQPVFTYLANSLRSGDRSIPYSVVTALDLKSLSAGVDIPEALSPQPGVKSIILNTWAANDLGVKSGDPVSLDYYVWEEEGRLSTRSADFRVAGIVPIE